jgi:hypothetical protein
MGSAADAARIKKLSMEGAWNIARVKVAVVKGVTDRKGTPKRCLFADFLNCPGTRTPRSF